MITAPDRDVARTQMAPEYPPIGEARYVEINYWKLDEKDRRLSDDSMTIECTNWTRFDTFIALIFAKPFLTGQPLRSCGESFCTRIHTKTQRSWESVLACQTLIILTL